MVINGSRVKNVTEGKWMTQEYADVPHGAAKSPFPAVYSNWQECCRREGARARARAGRAQGRRALFRGKTLDCRGIKK